MCRTQHGSRRRHCRLPPSRCCIVLPHITGAHRGERGNGRRRLLFTRERFKLRKFSFVVHAVGHIACPPRRILLVAVHRNQPEVHGSTSQITRKNTAFLRHETVYDNERVFPWPKYISIDRCTTSVSKSKHGSDDDIARCLDIEVC